MTHLQFAGDTLFFCEPYAEEIVGFKVILTCFELVSGLGINLGKSTLIGVGVEEHMVRRMVDALGYSMGTLPFKYLGLPVGGNLGSKAFWTPVVERVGEKIVRLGQKVFIVGGRFTLVKRYL